MKRIFLAIFIAIAVTASLIYAQTTQEVQLPKEIQEWESLAEKGDTSAMHKLLRFYDDNSPVYFEVEEVIEVETDGEYADTAVVVDASIEGDSMVSISEEMEAIYSARLEYWLAKGVEINDPVATYIKGMRLYYTDESASLQYLAKSAQSGNGRAALFCGSAFFNQGDIEMARKYQIIAYKANEPSAGWHLAMSEPDRDRAIEFMRKSAILNYPEAVLEMKRIEPNNRIWKHKVDSLEIDFPDFPIITD